MSEDHFNDGADFDLDDMPASPTIEGEKKPRGTSFPRVDSIVTPKLIDGSHETEFPPTMDENHVPPRNCDHFYSADPARGKYLDLIKQLLSLDNTVKTHLNVELATSLCEDAGKVFESESSLLDIEVAEKSSLVVVGDVHGQFADLVTHILSQQYDRPPGEPERRFLFMGDFVDRGPQGVEVIMLLFALKVEYPHMIFMLRGNHEECQTSRIYGFLYEVKQKFSNTVSVWSRFNEIFCLLPLAASVTAPRRKFFCAHGGLSPMLSDMTMIRGIDRAQYGNTMDANQELVVDGLLWSDPSDETDDFERSDRGCGYIFGVDATKTFCRNNGIDFVCRAHQLTSEGYCYTHDERCLTVFSAPNYCGINDNKGAIMVVGEHLEFVQFSSIAAPTAPLPVTLPWTSAFFQ